MSPRLLFSPCLSLILVLLLVCFPDHDPRSLVSSFFLPIAPVRMAPSLSCKGRPWDLVWTCCWCLKRQGLGKAGSRPYHSSYFVIYLAYAQPKKKPNKHPKTGSLAPNNPGRVMAWNILCPGCWRPRDVAQAPHWYLLRWSLPGKGRLSPEVISQTLTGSGGGLFLDHLGSFAPTASADDMGQSGAALGWDYSDYSFGETAVAGRGQRDGETMLVLSEDPLNLCLILGLEKHEFLGDHLKPVLLPHCFWTC